VAPMNAMTGTCPECEAQLAPGARFCPRCGGFAGTAAPGPVPGPVPGGRMPRAALPAAPSAAPPADATRADWSAPTVTRQPGYPPPRPQGGPPPGYQPTEFVPGGQQQDGYPPSWYAPDGYPPTEFAPGGYQPGPPQPPPQPRQAPRQSPSQGPPQAPRQAPRRHDRGRRGVPLALWIAAIVLLAGGAGAAVKILHHTSANAGTGTGTASAGASSSAAGKTTAPSGGTASTGTASGTPSAATEQQAAAGVAALLSQSAADRTATSTAASDIANCGPNLKSDPAVFGRAVTSRQALLAKLAALPGSATLPPALVNDLTGAWQASITADQAYAKWANDELAKTTCVPNDPADPGHLATMTPNHQATTDKTQFTAAWNPVAKKYGLTQYQPGQL